MSSITRVIPGQVNNNGIYDGSIPTYTPVAATYPCHYPVISVITPKGEMGQSNIPVSNFTSLFGNIMDPNTPYYNPISLLIQSLASGGQASIGVRRVSGNTRQSRIIIGLTITEADIPNYKREPDGSYTIGTDGNYIPDDTTPTIAGYVISVGTFDVSLDVGAQQKTTTTDPDTGKKSVTYPLFEDVAGVGDEYNKGGIDIGVASVADWSSISDFVETNGVFPYQLRMFTANNSGTLSYTSTVKGSSSSDLTLFNFTDKYSRRYGPELAVGAFTGNDVNRPHDVYPAPINSCYVYTDNINELCQLMFDSESANADNKLILDNNFDYPNRQMNPLTGVNHNGIPYYTIQMDDSMAQFHMSTHIYCTGGISPFMDDEGEYIVDVPPTLNAFGLPTSGKPVFDRMMGWEANQKLILADVIEYTNSPDLKDWTRNRQSVIWDVGYNEDIKDALVEEWAVRKDQIIVLDAGIYGEDMSPDDLYSMATSLTAKLRLYPESEKFGTPACRASINLWTARVIDEPTGDRFSLNIDLAYEFAKFGGNTSGVLYQANCPDHADNRIIQKMYDPLITFEDDDAAGDDFSNGCITLRPYDTKQYYRPALITVYDNPDSVLKDLTTTFICACIEKVCADQWTLVSGDTTISAINYASITKDNCERVCRNDFGGLVKDVVVDAYYDETQPNGRAIMKLKVSAWFNKGKYMMDMDLYAFNEEDSDTTTTTA